MNSVHKTEDVNKCYTRMSFTGR